MNFEDLLGNIKSGAVNQDNFNPEMLKKMPKAELEKLIKMLETNGGGGETEIGKVDQEGGMMIKPEPYFTVKAYDKSRQKFFINILGHAEIDMPDLQDIPSQNLYDASKEGIRIPLSLSEIREGFDKKEEACRVVDVAFNSEVAQVAQDNLEYQGMLMSIIFGRIKDKYTYELLDNYKLPKLKYKETEKGGVRLMRIRAKKDSKIEMISKEEKDFKDVQNNETYKSYIKNQMTIPNWNLYFFNFSNVLHNEKLLDGVEYFKYWVGVAKEEKALNEYDGFNQLECQHFILEVKLPNLQNINSLTIKVWKTYILINVIANYELKLKLPVEFEDNIWNIFIDEFKILYIIGTKKLILKDQIQNDNLDVKINNDLLHEVF